MNPLSRVRDLQDDEQDDIAALMLAELKDERGWDRQFAESPDLLAEPAREAIGRFGGNDSVRWPRTGARVRIQI